MVIKTIEEAKKYIDKSVYTVIDDRDADSNRIICKIKHLYIGGVNLFYNQVDYEVIGFSLYEDRKCQNGWGDARKEDIADKFDATERWKRYYFFSKLEAEKYLRWKQKDEVEQEEEYDIKTAKELLEKHKINYEIFKK